MTSSRFLLNYPVYRKQLPPTLKNEDGNFPFFFLKLLEGGHIGYAN